MAEQQDRVGATPTVQPTKIGLLLIKLTQLRVKVTCNRVAPEYKGTRKSYPPTNKLVIKVTVNFNCLV
jgi:hypothetical protein